MSKIIDQVSDTSINTSISEALSKIQEKPSKDGVDLLDIVKKLSSKKFGKK